MSKKHCKECGTNYDGSLKECPTCGCPAQYAEVINEAPPQAVTQTEDEQDFNEHYEYSPFSEDSWFKSEPWPLSSNPRRTFVQNHPFLGWLLDPWHLTCRDASKQEQYDTANNIFYMFNLFFKAFLYASLYTFFKIWWIVVGVELCFIVIRNIFMAANAYDDVWYYLLLLQTICHVILIILGTIVWCCGMGNALHRYWPSFHKTWHRVNKRYWKAMKD